MATNPSAPNARSDGEALRLLPSGLLIVRRRKHEPVEISNLSRDDLIKLTGKKFGSKFVAGWDLIRIADFIEQQVALAYWTRLHGPMNMVIKMNGIVGYSNGKPVAAIKIVSDGRHLHAYPVES